MNEHDYGYAMAEADRGLHHQQHHQQEQEPPEFSEMWWAHHSSLYEEDNSSVTATCYDMHTEMLWTGHASGRLTGYAGHETGADNANAAGMGGLDKYSSVHVADTPILELLPMYHGVLSVSRNEVRMHTSGGCGLARYSPYDPSGNNGISQSNGVADFTSAHFLLDYAEEAGFVPSSLMTGTSSQYMNIYDLSVSGPPVSMFNVEAPVVKLQSSQLYVAVGGGDGKVGDVCLFQKSVLYVCAVLRVMLCCLMLSLAFYVMIRDTFKRVITSH